MRIKNLLRRSIICSILLLWSCGSDNMKFSNPDFSQGEALMNFNFRDYQTADSAKTVLSEILPRGSSLEEIIRQMRKAGVKLYELQKNHTLPARFVEPSATMVYVVWSLAFYLDKNLKLENMEITRGLTGP
jgi:hypothetical protein